MITITTHSIAIYTDCPVESYRFYTGVLGMQDVSEQFAGTASPVRWLDGAVLIELIDATMKGPARPFDPATCGVRQCNWTVADVRAVWRQLRADGVAIVKAPYRPDTGDPAQPMITVAAAPEGTWHQFREPPGDTTRLPPGPGAGVASKENR